MFEATKLKIKENDNIQDEIPGRSIEDCLRKAWKKYGEQPLSDVEPAQVDEQRLRE